MNTASLHMLRYSLVTVWLVTTGVSLLDWQNAGSRLLVQSGITSEPLIQALIWGGATADLVIGLLLWFAPGRLTYLATLAALALLTGIATWLLPALWLDPLGPLLKNLPIAAIVLFLRNTEKSA